MIQWLQNLWASTSWTQLIVGTVLVILTIALSYVAVSVILVKLPADYFHSDNAHHILPNSHPILRTAAIVGRNILGVVLILTGIVLSFPGIPGPGLLTIFIGIMLTDFPGKRALELKIISRPSILSGINNLRARYDKPPLMLK
jgi:hypothetical protein